MGFVNTLPRFFLPAILTVVLAASVSHAGRLDGAAVAISIPERYTLLIAVIPKGEQLSQNEEAAIKTEMEAQREKLNVAQLQVAFYAEGTTYGDGVVALAVRATDLNPEWLFLFPKDDAHAKKLERSLGYDCHPKNLWQAFEDNEVVAEEDFKGKPIVIYGKCKGVAKDAFGKIYVHIPVDKTGLFGIQVYLKKDDPMLRQIKKGDALGLRILPQRYAAKMVLANGEILRIDHPKK